MGGRWRGAEWGVGYAGLATQLGKELCGGGMPQRVPTCHQVPNEKGLVFLVVLQHALEVLLLPLDGDLPVELMSLPLTLGQCLGGWAGKRQGA